jgi:hypothetical protein
MVGISFIKGILNVINLKHCFKFSYLLLAFTVSIVTTNAATITSNAVTGNWSTKSSWVGNVVPGNTDDVIIANGANITMQGSTTMNSLTINSGGILTDNGSGTITITGDLIVNGTFAGSSLMVLSGTAKNIDGSGVISNTSALTITGNKTIRSTASLIKGTGGVTLSASTSITNNGSITFGGTVNGSNTTTSIWVNGTNSTLNVGDALFGTGTLDATASGNTVNYYSSTPQTIKRTNLNSFTYWHLTISGDASATKTFASFSYIINGDLTINSALAGSLASASTITLQGNWVNNGGTFTANSASVTFSGSSSQTLSSVSGDTFYDLIVNNSQGIVADNNISVTNSLTMSAGNIDMGSKTLTLGTSTSNVGTLTHSTSTTSGPAIIGNLERWIGSPSSPSSPVLFPVGTSSAYRPLQLTLATVSTAGSLIASFVSSSPGNLPSQHLTDFDNNKTYNPFNDGYWTLTTNNSFASSSYSLSLTLNNYTAFTSSSFNGIDNGTRLLTRASASSSWALEGSNVTWTSGNGNTISRLGLSTLSGQYCLGDDTNCSAPSTSAITASSGTDICNGSTGQVYSVSTTGGSTYTWSLSSGGTISTGQLSHSISVAWSSSGGVRTVSVIENNGCATGSTVTLNVNVHPIAPGTITGKANAPTNTTGTLSNETYSITSASSYSYTWLIASGTSSGTIVSGQNTNSIAVQWGAAGTATVKVNGTYSGCSGTSSYTTLSVSVYSVIYSNRATGNWDASNTWTCSCAPGASDNVVILNGHTVSVKSGASEVVKHLNINTGGTFNTVGSLTVYGDATINGTIGGTGALTLSSSGSSPVLDGTGTFSTTPITLSANRTINSTASLTQTSSSGSFTVGSGVVVSNYGSLILASALTAGSTSSTWTNQASSKLTLGGAFFSSPSGILNASASGNTVTYAGSVAQSNIKSPSSSYYNLIVANTGGSKTAPASILKILGDFTNNSTSAVALPFDPNGGTIEFDGTATISGTATTTFNNLTVNTGASLSAPAAMIVLGTLQNNSTFTHNNGTVTFSSTTSATTAQISGGSKITFYNITVANGSAGTDLILENTAGAELTNTLDVGAATFDTDGASGNRVFTLLSTGDNPTVDASVKPLTGTSKSTQLPGKMTVQRYMRKSGISTYNNQVWRDISSPVSTTVFDLMNSSKSSGLYLPVTGFSGGSIVSDGNGGNVSGASLFTYDEKDTKGDDNADGIVDLNDGWTAFPVSSSSETFTAGQGYSIFIFGSDPPVSSNNNAKFDLTGIPNADSVNLPVSYTVRPADSNTSDYGWNLVGNPYPSAIDWSSTGWKKKNIANAIYLDDYQFGTGIFSTYSSGTGLWANAAPSYSPYTASNKGYIAMGQGFWVQATGSGTPVLKASENVKVAGQSTYVFRDAAPKNILRVNLVSSDMLRDESVICFYDSATTGFDANYDARKLNNQYGYFNLSSYSQDGTKYAINAMPYSNCGQSTVGLSLSDVASGTYQLNFSEFTSMPDSMQIQLNDKLVNTPIDVRQTQSYSFTVDQNDLSTYGSDRFSLIFTYNGVVKPMTLKGASICDPSQGKIVVSTSSPDFYYKVISPANGSVIVPTIAGIKGSLPLSIPSGSVNSGINHFIVYEVNRFCNTITSSDTISLNYVPVPSMAIAQGASSCGKGIVTLTASGAPTNGYYHWYDSLNAEASYLNQTSSFQTDSLSKSKTYYVATVNKLNCESQRSPINATVINLIPAVIIVSDLNTLQSNYSEGNQWYLDHNAIIGGTGQTLTISSSGNYQLVVNSQGCSVANEKELVVTAIEPTSGMIKIYPNPVKDDLTIEVDSNEGITGEILNSLGIPVLTLSFSPSIFGQASMVNLGLMSSGIYLVKINQGDKVLFGRVIKD